jgi:hypothetical protein
MHGRNHRPRGWYGETDPGGSDPLNWLSRDLLLGPGYSAIVNSIGSLIGYWKMDAASGDQPDYAGHPGGDEPLVRQGAGTDYAYKVTGALPPSQDDGAFYKGLDTTPWWKADDARYQLSGTAAMSLALFLRVHAYSAGATSAGVAGTFQHTGGSPSADGWGLLLTRFAVGAGEEIRPVFHRHDGGTFDTSTAFPVVGFGQWTHIGVTYDGTRLRMYRNGLRVVDVATTVGVTAQNDFRVLGGGVTSAGSFPYEADIDEVIIFGKALTDGEMFALASAEADPLQHSTVTVTGTYQIAIGDQHVLANGTFTVTLPDAGPAFGRIYTVKNTGSGTVTVARTASQTIDGAASNLTLTAGQSRRLLAASGGWQIVSGYL